jgi:nucleotide-binding universal stress UspA family protein
MFHSILVALDGSAFGEQALPLALELARRAGANLQLVHVHDPGADRLLTYYALDPRVKEEERAYLEAVVRRLTAQADVPVDPILLSGPVAETLQEYARATGADLVVMTTHGRGPLSRFWLGSVADRLVRSLPLPLLLVRPQEPLAPLEAPASLRRILILLDGSDLAEQILDPALALGNLMQAEYTLLRVIKPVPVYGLDLTGYAPGALDQSILKQIQEGAQTYLDGVAERLRARSLKVCTRVTVYPQAAAAILDEARAGDSQLIALTTHGRGGLRRLLLGSVADKVVRQATIPVLVQHPRE